MLLADRIASIVRMRLEMNVPVITKWASALSIQVTTCTTPVSPFLPASYFAAKHVNSHLCSCLSLQCLPNLTCIYFLQANPLNAATALKQRALLVDDIWHAAGDRSSDMDWYTKRALLGAVYMTAELYMLTDFTPGCGTLNSYSICSQFQNSFLCTLFADCKTVYVTFKSIGIVVVHVAHYLTLRLYLLK